MKEGVYVTRSSVHTLSTRNKRKSGAPILSRRMRSSGGEKAHPVPLMYVYAVIKNESARVEKERNAGKVTFKRDNPTERLVEAVCLFIQLSRTILIS
jgi:hypothetical protein